MREASSSEERILRNKESFLHKKMKRKQQDILSSNDSDVIFNEEIETWKEPKFINQVIMNPNSTNF